MEHIHLIILLILQVQYGIRCAGTYNISDCSINVYNDAESQDYTVNGIVCAGNGSISDVNVKVDVENGMGARGIFANQNVNVNIVNCKVDVSSNGGNVYAVYNNKNSTMKITDSQVIANSSGGTTRGIENAKEAIMEITNSNIKADAPGTLALLNAGKGAIGVLNWGTLTFYSGEVNGILGGLYHSDVATSYIYGGTFSSPINGGICFNGGTAYTENATLSCNDYEGEYTVEIEKQCGFLVNVDREVITDIYLNNCTIRGGKNAFLISGDSEEQIKNVYISNSTIGEDYEEAPPIDIKYSATKLNIGQGCNFDADDVKIPDSATITDLVTITNEVYTNPNK